jgi:hypothetical protein
MGDKQKMQQGVLCAKPLMCSLLFIQFIVCPRERERERHVECSSDGLIPS